MLKETLVGGCTFCIGIVHCEHVSSAKDMFASDVIALVIGLSIGTVSRYDSSCLLILVAFVTVSALHHCQTSPEDLAH